MGPDAFAPQFACHHSKDSEEIVCAGWLAAVGEAHPMVRMAVLHDRLPQAALDHKPELHQTYQEVIEKLRADEVPRFYAIPDPRAGMRARICRQRKRERRLALARAEREWVCGGPLVDFAKPFLTRHGIDGIEHAERLKIDLAERARRAQIEAHWLAFHFAERCLVRERVRERMLAEYMRITLSGAPLRVMPTHSTSRHVRTIHPDRTIRRF